MLRVQKQAVLVMAEATPVVITNQELDQLRKVAGDGGVGETLRELEDTLEETTDMVDELRVNLCKTQVAHEDLKLEAAAEKALQAGLKQEVATGKERVEELKRQVAAADTADAGLRQQAAADTALEDKDDEVSELRIKLLEAETEVTELKIKHSASAEQMERDAAQLRRELKAAAAAHTEVQREVRLWRACTRCAWRCVRPAWCRPCVCRRRGYLANRRIPDAVLRCLPRRCKCMLTPEDCLTYHARGW